MYIKSMIIDGFKSFGHRTEINGFDQSFNAIVDLNKSRKSNILNAIYFLLGIDTFSQVGAKNFQELVYENGQAGVTELTVTITFDNINKNQSPVEYEHDDEVTITRQVRTEGCDEYLINGRTVQSSRVQEFFQSSQLNVDEGHFLISQDRINEVLDMKPSEVLEMVKEAAGTGRYESKGQPEEKKIEEINERLKEIDTQFSKIILDEEKVEMLQTRQRKLEKDILNSQEQVNLMELRFPQLCFDYTDPEPNFNRNSVKGRVCNLMRLKDPQSASALEAVAGEMLYSVVVDNEETANKLLKNGNLHDRVTFIPLNKITGSSLENNLVQHAESLVGPDNVKTALSLISYDKEHHGAMQWVFGDSFVCKDMEAAAKVAFDPTIMKKAVTLDGDVCDPVGTISGGAHLEEGSVLTELNAMFEINEELNKNAKELAVVGRLLQLQNNDLMLRKRILKNDKEELDEKKKEEFRILLENVNNDFGSIFGMLLPGANAKLKPTEGMDVLEGLEVKIGFGGEWKESLSELSGSQRCLVALSLILALLSFKPAPIYIMDEVDSALDLSQKQNIGQVLRTHFKHSQFIIVSEKEGFNNAYVLFQTKLVDGISTVMRQANSETK